MTTVSPTTSAINRTDSSNERHHQVQIFSDGADLQNMLAAHRAGIVGGFTTNPTLMAKAGVKDYRAFAREVLEAIRDLPISFEVLADDFDGMLAQARELASWGDNVYVKIPIVNTRGEPCIGLIRQLSSEGVKINATALMTLEQVREVATVVDEHVPAVCSIFAGRIADTGRDPVPMMRSAVEICASKPLLSVLWASPREVLNLYQAEECGCHIITVTPEILSKMKLKGKDLAEYSRETAEMFFCDAKHAGLSL